MLSELGMRALRHRQRLDRRVAADPTELLAHVRRELGPVAVGVDDRVFQAGAGSSAPRFCPLVDMGHPPGAIVISG